MRKQKNIFIPCVYSITKEGVIKLRYSSKIVDDEMFGTPKVMFGIWNTSGKPVVDIKGKYGMCQHTMAIVDNPEVLDLIATAMHSDKFRRVMKCVQFNNNEWDRNIIKMFRKDFWKEFI